MLEPIRGFRKVQLEENCWDIFSLVVLLSYPKSRDVVQDLSAMHKHDCCMSMLSPLPYLLGFCPKVFWSVSTLLKGSNSWGDLAPPFGIGLMTLLSWWSLLPPSKMHEPSLHNSLFHKFPTFWTIPLWLTLSRPKDLSPWEFPNIPFSFGFI